ncbi:YjbH domain-containing protein [Fibrella sp. ES10-3-2-2]|nr:hypothetical protein A6C57_20765 [Fibrella sp. ES10-3-2-2]
MNFAQKIFIALLAVATAGIPVRLQAQMNISGKPGLIYIPSAELTQDGTFSIGYNFNPASYAFRFNRKNSESIAYVNLTLLPRLEVTINLLNPNGPINYGARGIGDRQVDLKYGLISENEKRPSIAAIMSAPFGIDNSLITYALVATKHLPISRSITAGVTVGMGSPYSIYRAEVRNDQNSDIFSGYTWKDKRTLPYHYLSGPFGGVNLNLARKGGLMVEWDSQHLNIGAYTTLFRHLTLQAGLLNGQQLTLGTSYTTNLLHPDRSDRRPQGQPRQADLAPSTIDHTLSPAEQQRELTDFENRKVDTARHLVLYEQRLYRNPFKGMKKLATALGTEGGAAYIPLFQGVPIARYHLGKTPAATTLSQQDRADLAAIHPFDSRGYKLDFRLQPEFIGQFGFRDQLVEAKTNLLLQSQLYLHKGLVLNWGVTLPIANTLDNQALNVRPAPTFINQFLALNGHQFMSLSAGLFYTDQYGVNVQFRDADITKRWSFGLESGLTGFYYFPENGFYYESLKHFMFLADVAYRIPNRDLTIKLSGGQYLYADRGARVDLIRQLGDVEVGFYAMKTRQGGTGGFSFAIPLPPGRIAQNRRVRLRSTDEFRWEYAYSRGYNIGTRYRLGYQLDALLRQYHSSYLQNQH